MNPNWIEDEPQDEATFEGEVLLQDVFLSRGPGVAALRGVCWKGTRFESGAAKVEGKVR
jgi:hypothetical protein